MSTAGFVENLRSEATRVGYGRAMQRSLYSVANKRLQIRRIEIIYLHRENLVPLDASKYTATRSRMATAAELLDMQAEGKWSITEELLAGYRKGNDCLLSFVGDQLAGYTWVNARPHPEILPGLRVSIPPPYLYNFAGFTLPEFRGFGLQPYRHHEILNRPEWRSREGLLGYVECTNWSSKKGQSKSGYQKLGELTLLGHGKRFAAFFSDDLKKRGIRRLHV